LSHVNSIFDFLNLIKLNLFWKSEKLRAPGIKHFCQSLGLISFCNLFRISLVKPLVIVHCTYIACNVAGNGSGKLFSIIWRNICDFYIFINWSTPADCNLSFIRPIMFFKGAEVLFCFQFDFLSISVFI
jgi:hypothetical protein